MLDREDYFKDWKQRVKGYEEKGLKNSLVTTDDLNGVEQDIIQEIMSDIISGSLKQTPKNEFSMHHYELYND